MEVEQFRIVSPLHAFAKTIRVGAAVWNNRLESFAGLLEQSDQALYQAKADGRNRVVRHPGAVEK